MGYGKFAMNARGLTAMVVVGIFVVAGCGGPSATVTGRVTCQGKPVVGMILFSPKAAPGDSGNAAGPSVTATLSETGGYEIRLTSIGKHTVVITPSDVVLRPKAGAFDYPCDRSPLERDIVAGANDVTIELAKRTK